MGVQWVDAMMVRVYSQHHIDLKWIYYWQNDLLGCICGKITAIAGEFTPLALAKLNLIIDKSISIYILLGLHINLLSIVLSLDIPGYKQVSLNSLETLNS